MTSPQRQRSDGLVGARGDALGMAQSLGLASALIWARSPSSEIEAWVAGAAEEQADLAWASQEPWQAARGSSTVVGIAVLASLHMGHL